MFCVITVDLVYGMTLLQVAHDSKIDWLELNETGHKLLFRDKKMRLTLLDTRSAQRHAILSYCTFVQVNVIRFYNMFILSMNSYLFSCQPWIVSWLCDF